ncbi:MAG: hypothetical protein DBX59_06375 [Bacillota bacterium]|nr:MAG: hypothetical protein DBX59_06375 [Bacillota bacterium]
MKFAVQLYSLRDMAHDKGGEAALKAVADAGYDGVEFAGFYGYTPAEMRALTEKYALTPISMHCCAAAVEENLPYIDALGIKYVFVAYEPKARFDDEKKFGEMLAEFERAHELLAPRGVTFGYHNHEHEFEDGKDRMKQLLEAAPYLKAEPDVCWLTVAGKDAAAYLESLGEKLALVHVKEVAQGEKGEAVIGEGKVNMAGVFGQIEKSALPWAVLEAEHVVGDTGEYLSRSLQNMKNFLK